MRLLVLLMLTGASAMLHTEVRLEDGVTYRLYLLTYATDVARPDFCLFAASAYARGFSLNVIGRTRQDAYKEVWQLDKAWALRDFLRAVPDEPHAIVAMLDAYDVLMNGSPRQMVQKIVQVSACELCQST